MRSVLGRRDLPRILVGIEEGGVDKAGLEPRIDEAWPNLLENAHLKRISSLVGTSSPSARPSGLNGTFNTFLAEHEMI